MKVQDSKFFHGALGALAAFLVLALILFVQYTRSAWPFLPMTRPVAQTPLVHGESDAAHERASVDVDPNWATYLGLRVEPAKTETISRELRATATVVPDEERVSHVHTRVSGWIEALYVRSTGEHVRAGQPLAAIYSQDLFASQTEYLAARARDNGALRSTVIESARHRLVMLGMSEREITEIERSGEARHLVTITAPREGVVLRRPVALGTAVDPSVELLTIADLSQVWIMAEIPENDIASVTQGAPAFVDIPGSGHAPFEASLDFLYPTVSERTRSLRVRIVVDNEGMQFRPGMTGTVRISSIPRQSLTVLRNAVVDTGDMQHVFVATAANHFEPRPIHIGLRLEDRVEVLHGLREGEPVLSSGVFLIDSESRLRGSGVGPGHGGHGSTDSQERTDSRDHQGH